MERCAAEPNRDVLGDLARCEEIVEPDLPTALFDVSEALGFAHT